MSGVNQDIEKLMNHNDEESRKLADQVLVFMARAVFKPTLALPITHYFSVNLTGILVARQIISFHSLSNVVCCNSCC